MRPYKDLFFDLDDTLYDTYGNAVIALRELFEAIHLERWFDDANVFYDEFWKANIKLWSDYSQGKIDRDYLMVERLRRPLSFGRGLEPTVEFCMKANEIYLDFCCSKPGIVEGARDLLEYLRPKGYGLHICSNGFHEIQYKKLEASGLDGYFDTIILSEDAGANKPSPLFFDYALTQTGASRHSTLMIGDNFTTDILGAKKAGLATAFYNRFPEFPAPEPVDYEVTSLRELMEVL